jgi:endoglucanase
MRYKYIFFWLATLMMLVGSGYFVWQNTLDDDNYGSLSKQKGKPPVFSKKNMLENLWAAYKEEYIELPSFRTLDRQRNDITTSEGQSYSMLRAVWQNDKDTFDKVWQWTKDNIWKENKLFAWLFGQLADGSYGVLVEQGGATSATDGDTDISLALILAYARWQDPKYLQEADSIIKGIWENAVVEINGKPYMLSNDLEKLSQNDDLILNPSYYAPYAYRIFAKIDTQNNWMGVVDTSYEVIQRSGRLPLDKNQGVGLPPDWVLINKVTGELSAPEVGNLTTNYSFDAMRTPWRIAMDWRWFEDERAKMVLGKFEFLETEWNTSNFISNTYAHNGEKLDSNDSPSVYGTSMGYFAVVNPVLAEEIYINKLLPMYDRDTQSWRGVPAYYDDNWVWFGMAFYLDELPNYFELVKDEQLQKDFLQTS